MNIGEYKCSVCNEIYSFGWSAEEAEAELAKNFGVPKEHCDIVCDDCYNEMFPQFKENTCAIPTKSLG